MRRAREIIRIGKIKTYGVLRCRKTAADRLLVHQRQAAGERGAAGGGANVARGHHQQSVHQGRPKTPAAQHVQVPGVQHQNDAA